MAFDGTEGAPETRAKAETWTAAYRTASPGETKGHFIGKDIINDILEQVGCMGIRIYYGLDNGTKKLLLVGTDAAENDMLGEGHLVANHTTPCPPGCSKNNILNS
jgi:hypothetical protein